MNISKSAGFVAVLENGDRRVVCEGDTLTPILEVAKLARQTGRIGKGKQSEPITSGLVYCTWREPSVVMRFRCDNAGQSGKTEA
jgi:hypothetical protein